MNSATQTGTDEQNENQIALLSARVRELTEANEALANTQILLDAMLENIPDRIYFKDAKSRFVKVSKALAKRMGITNLDDVVGKTDFDFFPIEKAREFYEDEQRIIQTGEPLINKIEKHILSNGDVSW